jgi:hypothetical protein
MKMNLPLFKSDDPNGGKFLPENAARPACFSGKAPRKKMNPG